MSSFTQPLIVRKIDAHLWMIEQEFEYHVGSEESEEVIKVPVGFQTDFASVPRFFWTLYPPDGQYTAAAVIHDYAYYKHLYPRKRCDEIFLEAMKVLKVPLLKRTIMFLAVRIFGGLGWNHHRRRERVE